MATTNYVRGTVATNLSGFTQTEADILLDGGSGTINNKTTGNTLDIGSIPASNLPYNALITGIEILLNSKVNNGNGVTISTNLIYDGTPQTEITETITDSNFSNTVITSNDNFGYGDIFPSNFQNIAIRLKVESVNSGDTISFQGGDNFSLNIKFYYKVPKPPKSSPRFSQVRYTPFESLLIEDKGSDFTDGIGQGDMGFIIDNSDSINDTEWETQINGISTMLDEFEAQNFFTEDANIEPPLKCSITYFSACNQTSTAIGLTGSYNELTSTLSDLITNRPDGSSTQPYEAFKLAYNENTGSESRNGAQKILLYISDGGISDFTIGCSNINNQTEVPILTDNIKEGTHTGGIPMEIWAIGIGNSPILSPSATEDYAPVNLCSFPMFYYLAEGFDELVNPVVFDFVQGISEFISDVLPISPLSPSPQSTYDDTNDQIIGDGTFVPSLSHDGTYTYNSHRIPFQFHLFNESSNESEGWYSIFRHKLPDHNSLKLYPINGAKITYVYNQSNGASAIFEHFLLLRNNSSPTNRWSNGFFQRNTAQTTTNFHHGEVKVHTGAPNDYWIPYLPEANTTPAAPVFFGPTTLPDRIPTFGYYIGSGLFNLSDLPSYNIANDPDIFEVIIKINSMPNFIDSHIDIKGLVEFL